MSRPRLLNRSVRYRRSAWGKGKRCICPGIVKQPGGNVSDTVDRIKAALPRLELALPPAIKVDLLSDRTQTIRAAVKDVQVTLGITIVLVVLVIFAFLR